MKHFAISALALTFALGAHADGGSAIKCSGLAKLLVPGLNGSEIIPAQVEVDMSSADAKSASMELTLNIHQAPQTFKGTATSPADGSAAPFTLSLPAPAPSQEVVTIAGNLTILGEGDGTSVPFELTGKVSDSSDPSATGSIDVFLQCTQ